MTETVEGLRRSPARTTWLAAAQSDSPRQQGGARATVRRPYDAWGIA
jgi:hypothetical protein